MGALFELLAELITALVVAALAQFGVADQGSAAREPAVQRTVLQADSALPGTRASEDCEDRIPLQAA